MGKVVTDDEMQAAINAYYGNGENYIMAARALGWPRNTLKHRVKMAQERKFEHQPMHSLPDGHLLKGVSQYYNKDGKAAGVWIKTSRDFEAQKLALLKTAESLTADIPRAKKTPAPKNTHADLLATYVLTDYHMGLLAWGPESGADWNLQIAEDLLVRWFAAAIDASPAADTALLMQLGDLLHIDNLLPITPTSGHILDADARYPQIVEAVVRALRRVINMLLEKHKHVHVMMCEGNHDIASSVWLRAMFAALYEKEPRVTVDNTHTPYYAYEWGLTSIFAHHGHKRKMEDLSRVFAGMYRDIFGRTKYSYAHVGHLHHIASKEDHLMIVRQHPTLAAKDAHATRGGYVSNRAASVIIYSKRHGEVSEITIRPEMVEQ